MSNGWNNPETAQKYEAYAQRHRMYRDTSRDLVRLADISETMQVLDLCCGTGITSEAVLQKLGDTGHCYAVDLSPAMLAVAREKITNKNISFHESPAESLHTVPEKPLDRIVCNSAFWQVDADETLIAAHKALKSDGYFAFDLPGGFYDIPDDDTSREQAPNLREMMYDIAEKDYGYKFSKFKSIIRWQLNYETVLGKLDTAGFRLQHYEVLAYQQSHAASLEFCTIPIMTERTLPDVPYETRMEILKQASAALNPEETFTQKWAYFVAIPK